MPGGNSSGAIAGPPTASHRRPARAISSGPEHRWGIGWQLEGAVDDVAKHVTSEFERGGAGLVERVEDPSAAGCQP